MSSVGPALDMFPKLARANAERLSRHVAIREKDLGIWQSYTWRDYFERRPEMVLATQALGGVPVPLDQDSSEKELTYVVDHAEARFAVAGDQEQVDKLLQVRAHCPRLEVIVYDDPHGLRVDLGALGSSQTTQAPKTRAQPPASVENTSEATWIYARRARSISHS